MKSLHTRKSVNAVNAIILKSGNGNIFHNYDDTFDNATTFTFNQSCANVPLFDTNPLGNQLKEILLESWINNRQIEIRSRYQSEETNRRREQRGA